MPTLPSSGSSGPPPKVPLAPVQWQPGDPIPKDVGPSQRLLLRLYAQDPQVDLPSLASRFGRSTLVTKSVIRRLHNLHGITILIPGGPTF